MIRRNSLRNIVEKTITLQHTVITAFSPYNNYAYITYMLELTRTSLDIFTLKSTKAIWQKDTNEIKRVRNFHEYYG